MFPNARLDAGCGVSAPLLLSACTRAGSNKLLFRKAFSCGARYVLRLVALLGVLLIITEQYMEPTIANSIVPLAELNWARIFERVLKLSIPTLYGWILIFYSLFHVWLNIVAELTYFGDREFYKVRCSAADPPAELFEHCRRFLAVSVKESRLATP